MPIVKPLLANSSKLYTSNIIFDSVNFFIFTPYFKSTYIITYEAIQNTIENWKKQKINSIICLLSDEEIQTYYKSLNNNLISYYEKQGFEVFHVSIEDYQNPPVGEKDIKRIYEQYKNLKKPILVHCGAGKDRTGQIISYILNS